MIGDILETNSCGAAEVIGDFGKSIKVRFLGTGTEVVVLKSNARRGEIKDRNKPVVCGVGFIGYGEFDRGVKTTHIKAYRCWHNMLIRCYDDKYQKKHKTYYGCTVCEEWHNFQNFAKWFYENYPDDGEKYHLDKDVKVKGNKVYSPETCLFITQKENLIAAAAKIYKMKSPSGELFEIYNMAEFCSLRGLDNSSMVKVANGVKSYKSHKGWIKA